MKKEEVIGLGCSVNVEEDVSKVIRNVGVRGLSIEKAREFGVYERISKLLTAYHTTMMSGYRIYGQVYALMESFGGCKNDIARACNQLDKAQQKFMSFWTDYYSEEGAVSDMNDESEALYHNIMQWAQLPEFWCLGDKQYLEDDTDIAIKLDLGDDKVLKMTVSETNEEILDSQESWCVTKIDTHTRQQECVEVGMDKASALMVAKRMSDDDKESVYTASRVRDITKKYTEVTPFKAFCNNKTVGKITKTFR